MNLSSVKKVFGLAAAAVGVVLLIWWLVWWGASFFKKTVTIKVSAIPDAATLKFQGKSYTTPLNLQLQEGTYQLVLSKDGYLDRKVSLNVDSKGTKDFAIRLYTTETAPTAVVKDLSSVTSFDKTDLQKLIPYLPYQTENFRVEYQVISNRPQVVITLFAILNSLKSSQYERYKKQLKEYGQQALDWISSKQVNTDNLDIVWKPTDPATLQ